MRRFLTRIWRQNLIVNTPMATYSKHNDPEESFESAEDTAADWISRRNEGLSDDSKIELQRWLDHSEQNKTVFESLDLTWKLLGDPERRGRTDDILRQLQIRQRRRRVRRRAWVGSSLAMASILTFIFIPKSPSPVDQQMTPTMVRRPDVQILVDGTRVELNAGAQITSAFTAKERTVHLLRGEALFEVTEDAARPFVVTAGDIQVRAVGTAFSVRYDPTRVDVLVTKGKVAVEQAGSSVGQSPLYLGAGDKAALSADTGQSLLESEITTMTDGAIAAALAWRGDRIEFTGTPLSKAVTLFNHQNSLQIKISGAVLSKHRISGVFWVNDPEGFIRLLETGLGVSSSRSARGIILRKK